MAAASASDRGYLAAWRDELTLHVASFDERINQTGRAAITTLTPGDGRMRFSWDGTQHLLVWGDAGEGGRATIHAALFTPDAKQLGETTLIATDGVLPIADGARARAVRGGVSLRPRSRRPRDHHHRAGTHARDPLDGRPSLIRLASERVMVIYPRTVDSIAQRGSFFIIVPPQRLDTYFWGAVLRIRIARELYHV